LKKLLDKKIAHKIINDIRKTQKDFWKLAITFRERFNNDLPRENILKLFKDFHEISRQMHAYFMTSREEPMKVIEDELKKLIVKEYSEKFLEPFITLTTPTEKDLLFHEKKDFLAICNQPTDKKIKEHSLKYPLMLFNIYSGVDALSVMRARMNPEEIEKIKKEISSFELKKKY